MTVEPHPYPERTFWRIAPPVAAAVLAAIGFTWMLGVSPGATQTVVLVVVLVAQIALMGGRGLYLRQTARLEDQPVRWHQVLFAWSGFTGVTYLLNADYSTVSAALHIGEGLVFAVLLVGILWSMNRAPRS